MLIKIKIVFNIHQNQPASLRRSLPSMPECMHRLIASSHWIRNAKPPTNTCCTQAVQYSCIVQRDRKKFPGFRMKQIIKTTKPGCQWALYIVTCAPPRPADNRGKRGAFLLILIYNYSEVLYTLRRYVPSELAGGGLSGSVQVTLTHPHHHHRLEQQHHRRQHSQSYFGLRGHVNSFEMSATSRPCRTRRAVLEGQFVLRVEVKCFQIGAAALASPIKCH